MVDYSRWDNLTIDDDEEEEGSQDASDTALDQPDEEEDWAWLEHAQEHHAQTGLMPGMVPISDDTLRKFLALRPSPRAPSGSCSSHVHIHCRQSFLEHEPPCRAFDALVVEAFYHTGCPIPDGVPHTADEVMPRLLEVIAREYLNKHGMRPSEITTCDAVVADWLRERIGGRGATVECIDARTRTVHFPMMDDNLQAILDAQAVNQEEGFQRCMEGRPITAPSPDGSHLIRHPGMAEDAEPTARPSKSHPGAMTSTVHKQGRPVPPECRFCCNPACGKLQVLRTLKKCAGCRGCRVMLYCDRKCQKAHWRSGHRDACASKARTSL